MKLDADVRSRDQMDGHPVYVLNESAWHSPHHSAYKDWLLEWAGHGLSISNSRAPSSCFLSGCRKWVRGWGGCSIHPGWDLDHSTKWLQNGRPHCVTSHEYNHGQRGVDRIIEQGLDIRFSTGSWYHPSTTLYAVFAANVTPITLPGEALPACSAVARLTAPA